ncbi:MULTISPECIES: hypothetical protein [Agrobacterium]|jgi:hypothetical protein|nr:MULTISPECIES: hypothetical protein [Agrobacterium]MDA5638718.1 hypothetical protein [Agrobacterium sp. ST15.13.013]MDA6998354.1 hypothetical protein [Agrobacterium salinitolerans]
MSIATGAFVIRQGLRRCVSFTVGHIVTLFEQQECANYFKSCGYDPE